MVWDCLHANYLQLLFMGILTSSLLPRLPLGDPSCLPQALPAYRLLKIIGPPRLDYTTTKSDSIITSLC